MIIPRAMARSRAVAILSAIRAYQWIKNILVFVPLITSHSFLRTDLITKGVLAFIALSLCASSVYVINDLADIDSDRRHPSKRHRPFASGELPIPVGLLLVPLLLGLGIFVASFLPGMGMLLLLVYVAMSTAYTFWLKGKLLADVVTLALLYTVRIVLGGAATSIVVSPWLLAFSLFLFMSLAFSKRVTELIQLSVTQVEAVRGRGYLATDVSTLACLGMTSGCMACLILSLYINSESVRSLYTHPGWLWLLLPLLLNWIGRLWVVTTRGGMSDDPIRFVCKDLTTLVSLICGGVILTLAMKSPFGIPGIEE